MLRRARNPGYSMLDNGFGRLKKIHRKALARKVFRHLMIFLTFGCICTRCWVELIDLYGRNNRYEVLHRRYWPKFHSCYDSAKYLAEEFAKPPNYFQRSKILKAIALFGLAPADIFDITTRLTKFVLSLLQVLDIENPEYYTQ